ncbi:hypothetical protein RHGRI_001314 [Rhododendron griersonianum]|uniref:PsbP C-terminal domain-containing protein n=1 Tax=Rhododendron griersonianum TaxID=479676 RepID=A0AAV6LK30_9ERIC|nr:hypothetical protein RHGRI_001314 [Rhododendron griersonianum]
MSITSKFLLLHLSFPNPNPKFPFPTPTPRPLSHPKPLTIRCAKKRQRTGNLRYPSEKKKLKSKQKTQIDEADKFEGFWRLYKLGVPVHTDPGKDFLGVSDALLEQIAKALKFPKPTRESNESPNAYPTTKITCLRKRVLNLFIVAVTLSLTMSSSISKVTAQDLELERYTDSKQGFTLLRPPSWVKVEKAGATVLFEEPNKATNNLGIVVSPVRLTKLEEFGSPQFVADKLIQVEKRKESTKDADIIGISERSGNGGLQVYEFEYKLDSTRGGMKRIFTAVFVASKKLYILNIAHSDKSEGPLDMHRKRLLEQVLHSFDAAL